MDYLNWALMALIGLGSGAYGVLVGAGGGFILGPALLIISDSEPESVAGTVLAAIALNSALASWTYRKAGVVDYRSGLLFAGAAAPGAVVGAMGAGAVAPEVFRIAFGALLILLAAYLALRPAVSDDGDGGGDGRGGGVPKLLAATVKTRTIRTRDGDTHVYRFDEALATSFNVALGFVSSFFGVGGGFLRTPILVTVFGFPVRVAAASSVFALALYGGAGAATHAALGHIEPFPTLVFGGIGLALGGQIGARLSGRVKGAWIMRMLLVVVLALGIRLIWQGAMG